MRAAQVVSEEAGPVLQMKRSLLPIDEYAAREGVSREILERCGQLGIVRIRRYKGRTFVVDVPLGPYSCVSEDIGQALRPVDMAARAGRISEPVQKTIPSASLIEQAREMPDIDESSDVQEQAESLAVAERSTAEQETIKAGTIAELVKRMSQRASKTVDISAEKNNGDISRVDEIPASIQVIHTVANQEQLTCDGNRMEDFLEPAHILQHDTPTIINEPAASSAVIAPAETAADPIQPPDWEIFESPDESSLLPEGRDELPQLTEEDMEAGESPLPVRLPQENNARISALSPRLESNRIWKVAAVLLMAFFVTALIVNVGFYVDRQLQFSRLEMMYAGVQTARREASQANEEVKILKNRLTTSRAEARRFRKELLSSRAEVKAVEKELARLRENLQTTHQVNAEALQRFNNQIKNLITLTE